MSVDDLSRKPARLCSISSIPGVLHLTQELDNVGMFQVSPDLPRLLHSIGRWKVQVVWGKDKDVHLVLPSQ